MFAINSAYFNAYLALVFLTKEKWVWGFFVSPLLYARHKTGHGQRCLFEVQNIPSVNNYLLYGVGPNKLVMDPGKMVFHTTESKLNYVAIYS